MRSGKIPLVKSKEKTTGWPAGNPTAIKHVLDTDHYEMAEDEPFYASKVILIHFVTHLIFDLKILP